MYNLTEQEQKEVDILEQQIADRMVQLSTFEFKKRVLMQAFIILQELGEHAVSNELLRASKRLGDKLKDSPTAG